MNESMIFIAMVAVAIVLGVIGVSVIKSLNKDKKNAKKAALQDEAQTKITLEDLIIIVSDKRSSKEEIAKAVLYFIQKFLW